MSFMAPTVRFDSNKVITEEQLRKHIPSVFATEAHESRSSKFVPIPTIEILRGLKNEGFEVVGGKQGRCRTPGKTAFTKHILRLRKTADAKAYQVGDTVAEVTLRNGNDGTSRYRLAAMLFRIACLNGMTVKLSDIEDVAIGHIGKNVRDDVIEGTYRVIKDSQLALAAPREWSQIRLDRDERMVLANAVHHLRFADDETGEIRTPVTAEQMLTPRRRDDTNPDLWTVTNVLQEHAIRGGDSAYGRDAQNRQRRVTTRAVNGIEGDLKLNRAIFTLADQMAKLKGARPLTEAKTALVA